MFLLVQHTNDISLHKLLKKEVLCFCLFMTQMPSHYINYLERGIMFLLVQHTNAISLHKLLKRGIMFLLVQDTNAISLHKLFKKEVLCFCLYSTQMTSHYINY